MLSCQHSLQDDRIYWKEALTLKQAGYKVIHIGAGSVASDYFSAEGIRLITIPAPRFLNAPVADKIFKLIRGKPAVTDLIFVAAKAVRADVYHFHDLQINKIGKRLKRLPWSPKVIYDVHESYPDLLRDLAPRNMRLPFSLYAYYVNRWEAACIRHYDAVITTEPYVFDRMKPLVAAGKCIDIIYNYSYFLPPDNTVPQTEKKYDIIYSGSISAVRGIYELIDAIGLIVKSRPAFRALIIGFFNGNGLKLNVAAKIASMGLAKHVVLHDPVPFTEMSAFYQQSRIGICLPYPVKLHRNAVFIKIFEYMAFGLPIVCSDVQTTAKYVTDADAGIIVDSVKPLSIAQAVVKIIDHPALYAHYSKNGTAIVQQHYNWKMEVPKLLSLYNKILLISK